MRTAGAGLNSLSFGDLTRGPNAIGDIQSYVFDQTAVPSCNGQTATVYVDAMGNIVGRPDDGDVYSGLLRGTNGDDVLVGTSGVDRSGAEVVRIRFVAVTAQTC